MKSLEGPSIWKRKSRENGSFFQTIFIFVENKECTQDQSKHRDTIEGRRNDKAIRAETEWANKELMDLIEAVPYQEQFNHSFEEAMPRG